MEGLLGGERTVRHLADVLKALAHPVRLGVVAALCGEELNVGALAERVGQGQSTVSQQLRILRMSGLVEAARSNGFVIYRLAEPRLRELVRCLEGCSVGNTGGPAARARGSAAAITQGGRG
jgi:DNA-binding transcriptional ArsR family regulator